MDHQLGKNKFYSHVTKFALSIVSNSARSAGSVGYTDCISVEGNKTPPRLNKCPRYNIKQSDGALKNAKYLFIAKRSKVHSGSEW